MHTTFRLSTPSFAVGAICALLLAVSPAPAQSTATQASVKDPAIASTIEKTKEHYRSLESYQDVLLSTQSVELAEGSSDPSNLLASFSGQSHEYTLAYESPRRFKLEADEIEIASDGKQVIIANHSVGQFRIEPLADKSIVEIVKEDVFGQIAGQHPILIFMLDEVAHDEQLVSVLNNAHAMRTDSDGRIVISSIFEIPATMRAPNMPADVPLEIRLDPKTYAIETIATDMTNILRPSLEELKQQLPNVPDIKSCWSTLSITDVRTNSDIPSSALAVNTSALEQVQQFDLSDIGRPSEPGLVGKPAPMFTSTTLQGGDFDLSDFKGKTVVLDFWATWCKPCVAAMPHLEAIAQEYKDKNVVVIGVNQDDGDMRDKMRQIIKQTGASFMQVMDPKGAIGRQYGVQALPTTVIIDSSGTVQVYEMGFYGRDHLKQQIDQIRNK